MGNEKGTFKRTVELKAEEKEKQNYSRGCLGGPKSSRTWETNRIPKINGEKPSGEGKGVRRTVICRRKGGKRKGTGTLEAPCFPWPPRPGGPKREKNDGQKLNNWHRPRKGSRRLIKQQQGKSHHESGKYYIHDTDPGDEKGEGNERGLGEPSRTPKATLGNI